MVRGTLRNALFSLSLALASTWSEAAHAQELSQAQREEAHALFDAGRAAFAEGRYEAALGHFERSYELTGAPELLYNIGHTADRIRRDERALEAFEAYLAALPSAPERAEVEARLRTLRAAIQERRDAAASEREAEPAEGASTLASEGEAADPIEPVPRVDASPAGWIVAGTGALGSIAGAILLAVASMRAREVDNAPEGTPWSDLRGAYADADTFGVAGGVMLGVGIALTAAGIVWGVVDIGSARAEVALGPASVGLRGRF